MSEYLKPLPIPSPESQPFWDTAREHRLSVQQCRECGESWFPPSTLCLHCGSRDYHWFDASGRGVVHSFVIYHRLYHEGWEGEVPYVVALVELDEGPRLYANLVETEIDEVACDMKVSVVFDDVTETCTIPKFRPSDTI
jgi:uncharacterized OB-fold protein